MATTSTRTMTFELHRLPASANDPDNIIYDISADPTFYERINTLLKDRITSTVAEWNEQHLDLATRMKAFKGRLAWAIEALPGPCGWWPQAVVTQEHPLVVACIKVSESTVERLARAAGSDCLGVLVMNLTLMDMDEWRAYIPVTQQDLVK